MVNFVGDPTKDQPTISGTMNLNITSFSNPTAEIIGWFAQDTHKYSYSIYVDDLLVQEEFWIEEDISYTIELIEFGEYQIKLVVVDIEMNSASLTTVINYQLGETTITSAEDDPDSPVQIGLTVAVIAGILFFGTFMLRVRIKKLKFG